MSERRHRTVRRSEIGAHPWGRMDAGYWLAPDVVKAVMDEKPSRTREQAELVLDRRRRVVDSDDAVRFLLDGLGVDSIADLRNLVERGRASEGWPALLRGERRFESGLVLPDGTPLVVDPRPDGWATGHFRPDPFKLSRHVFALAPDDYTLLLPR